MARAAALAVLLVCGSGGGCGGDGAAVSDVGGQREGPLALAEDNLERCTDGKDNDADGKTDCADDGCAQLLACQQKADAAPAGPENTAALCRDGRDNDGDGQVDCADAECHEFVGCLDAGALRDGAPGDAPRDAPLPDLPLQGCKAHCDCPQGWFCYKGTCVHDPKMDVYCCAKAGCPPGKLCMDLAGQKSTCAEDPAYACQTACDCGPAHCCKSGKCVKDTADPWLTGGVAIGGLSCSVGTDPTYCCADFACHEGRSAYDAQNQLAFFKCYDSSKAAPTDVCGGKSCFGTACNCDSGEVCVDTATKPTPSPGSACHLSSGGSCMSGAAAEAIFGWPASELLPCCKAACTPGATCDAGWKREGGKFAYQRVKGTCGPCADGQHFACGVCGNGKCDEGEYPDTCPQDCKCGDGKCAPAEVGACAGDCGTCGDGNCGPGESNLSCAADCNTCGDGWCAATEVGTCTQDCWGICRDATSYAADYRICGDGVAPHCGGDFKVCGKCALDCPETGWEVVHRATAPPWSSLTHVWGSSGTDVYALGPMYILHFDGATWAKTTVPGFASYTDIWGSSAADVYVTGHSGTAPVLARYDGKAWKAIALPAPSVGYWYNDLRYGAVGGTSATDVFVAGALSGIGTCRQCNGYGVCYDVGSAILLGCALWRYTGGAWNQSAELCVDDFWGLSAADVFGVEMGALRYGAPAGVVRMQSNAITVSYTNVGLGAVWGASSTSVFAVGDIVARFDGASWKPSLDKLARGVWGSSSANAYVVGGGSSQDGPQLARFDGTSWLRIPFLLDPVAPGMRCPGLNAIWGSADGSFFAVGDGDLVLRCGGSGCTEHAIPLLAGALTSIGAPTPADAGLPPQSSGCGNGICETCESCDGRTVPAGVLCTDRYTNACPADCPGPGTTQDPYCCVQGVCVGTGCPVASCP